MNALVRLQIRAHRIRSNSNRSYVRCLICGTYCSFPVPFVQLRAHNPLCQSRLLSVNSTTPSSTSFGVDKVVMAMHTVKNGGPIDALQRKSNSLTGQRSHPKSKANEQSPDHHKSEADKRKLVHLTTTLSQTASADHHHHLGHNNEPSPTGMVMDTLSWILQSAAPQSIHISFGAAHTLSLHYVL